MLRVGFDVAPQLAGQIGRRREDAARQHVPLHLREPQLHLIQPRRIRRREVQRDVGMRLEKRRHELRFVGGQVVEDHADFLIGLAGCDHFPQKA